MPPILLAFLLHFCAAGKPVIDTNAIDHWPSLAFTPQISVYGNFVAYTTTPDAGKTFLLTVCARQGGWEMEFPGAARCYFSADERQAVIPKADSLYFLRLGTDRVRRIRVASWLWPALSEGRWLVYQLKPSGKLILHDLLADTSRDLGTSMGYGFDPGGRLLAVQDSAGFSYVDLQTGERYRIWAGDQGDQPGSFCWDDQGLQLAFVVTGHDAGLWYCRIGRPAVRIVTDRIDGPIAFSRNGRWLFFALVKTLPANMAGDISPIVWTWQDRSFQQSRNVGPATSWVVTNTDGSRLRRLEDADRHLLTPPQLVTGDWVLIRDTNSYGLLSLLDGTLKHLEIGDSYPADFSFSPGGRWFLFYEPKAGQYVSCDLETGRFHTITAGLPYPVASEFPHNVLGQAVDEPAGWLQGDSAVLLYDDYDCWAVDPGGNRKPLSISYGYGRKHRVKLRLIREGDGSGLVFSNGDTLLFTGFNTENKNNGFFRQILGRKRPPDSLFMGPYTFYRTESQKPQRYSFDDGMRPVRAAGAHIWMIKRESAKEAPNYFLTAHFRQFEQITNLKPQEGYNWLTAELISYTMLDGSPGQGILYKPENFDPAKRYPVLFNIYEQLSHRLYEFPPPELSRDNINIPWFVSRGYLVFTPDIRYKPATLSDKTVGQWAYNSVIAAVRYLSRLPFVDSKRLGIQGHSLGAEETNYILVNTNVFKAAVEMAGPTDPISAYLTLLPVGDHLPETRESQYIWEGGQARLGATLWQRPDLYLRESAVLHADKINTPLLIIHNPKDAAVQGRQGVELFMALRRLAKPVWLLQYPDGNHSLLRHDDALDYTFRLMAYFDHFLRDRPLPGWMASQR